MYRVHRLNLGPPRSYQIVGDPRELWPRESGLHRWLAANPGLLAQCLGLQSLKFTGRETVVGTPVPSSDGFGGERWRGGLRLDLAARDKDGRVIIIEVQCRQPDHKHLGQLVSYAKAANAAIAVWLVADADPLFCVEHLEVLAEFNEVFAGRRVFIPVTLTLESEPTVDPPAPATPVLPSMRRISLPDGSYGPPVRAREVQYC